MSTCDFFNCLFPLDVQNEKQLLSRVFCYAWLVCLFRCCLRNASLVKVGNPISDGIVFFFHLAWCVRGFKSLKRSWPYLIAFRSCISNGKPEQLLYLMFPLFLSNFIKSRTVYASSLYTFVRVKTVILPSIRFDISLQNFKKPLDIFSNRK